MDTMESFQTKIKGLIQEPVGILGFGIEGQSSYSFLKQAGIKDIIIFEKNPQVKIPEGVRHYVGENYMVSLQQAKTVIRSAGIRPDLPLINEFQQKGGALLSQLEILLELYPREKVIGITGTLGKGTTATLLYEMMKREGLPCLLGGNIGIPMLDLLEETPSYDKYLILELSSFQLSTAKKSPGTALILKTTEEHLDWHKDKQEYWQHKANITRYQTSSDKVFFNSDDEGSSFIAQISRGTRKSYGVSGDIKITQENWILDNAPLPLSNHKIKGSFNLENIAAAALVAQGLGVSSKSIKTSALEFTGLKHRLEYLGETEKFTFYNDSYATRPDATIGAIRSFGGLNLGLILGGSEKNATFTSLSECIVQARNLKHIVLIGETSDRLMKIITSMDKQNKITLEKRPSLFEALDHLVNVMEEGVILLSPACASFGLFNNYQERGEAFKEMVYSYIYSHT